MNYAEPSFQNSWRFKLCKEFGPVIGVLPEILGVADDCTFVCVCVCTDIPLSVGILDPRASPTQLNAVEFLWDPSKGASAFIQVSRKEVALLGRSELWGPSCCFSKPSMGGALMGFCPWLQARRLRGRVSGAQSHETGWSLGLGGRFGMCG